MHDELYANPRLNAENSILPCILSEINSNASKLNENDKEIEALNQKLDESVKAIKTLQSTKAELEAQNEMLRIELETNHSQKQSLKQKYEQSKHASNMLQTQIKILSDELETINNDILYHRMPNEPENESDTIELPQVLSLE